MIELLTKKGCSGCEKIKRVFDAYEVDYVLYDIDTLDGKVKMADLAGAPTTVPILIIDGLTLETCEVW